MGQVFFNQKCQVCCRPMRVRIELMGQEIRCGHCTALCTAGRDSDDRPWLNSNTKAKSRPTKAHRSYSQSAGNWDQELLCKVEYLLEKL